MVFRYCLLSANLASAYSLLEFKHTLLFPLCYLLLICRYWQIQKWQRSATSETDDYFYHGYRCIILTAKLLWKLLFRRQSQLTAPLNNDKRRLHLCEKVARFQEVLYL